MTVVITAVTKAANGGVSVTGTVDGGSSFTTNLSGPLSGTTREKQLTCARALAAASAQDFSSELAGTVTL